MEGWVGRGWEGWLRWRYWGVGMRIVFDVGFIFDQLRIGFDVVVDDRKGYYRESTCQHLG